MTREEHRIRQLTKVAERLAAAANDLYAHMECEALRQELQAMEKKVRQRIEEENPALLTNLYTKGII